jgi:uncharacterized protein
MKRTPQNQAPADADARRAIKPVICYPIDTLPVPNMAAYAAARKAMELTDEVIVPPRDARTFRVPSRNFFRIVSVEGPQVGDLNLWSADDLSERFYSGKTRALHGTHLSTGDRMWSSFPHMRPMATITSDTLDWYGFDAFGAGVHDVIGTRCDPYTNRLLSGRDYHHCCHSNLTRALVALEGLPRARRGPWCMTCSTSSCAPASPADTGQYFMKASPVRRRLHRILRRDRLVGRTLGLPRR